MSKAIFNNNCQKNQDIPNYANIVQVSFRNKQSRWIIYTAIVAFPFTLSERRSLCILLLKLRTSINVEISIR